MPRTVETPFKVLNPSTIPAVLAKVTAATEQPPPGCVAKPPRSTQFTIASPLLEFNQKKRKADDDDGAEPLLAVAPFWAVLHAPPGEKGNMAFTAKVMEDSGFIGQDLPKLRRGQASKLEIAYLTNTRAISAGDLLLLPPIN